MIYHGTAVCSEYVWQQFYEILNISSRDFFPAYLEQTWLKKIVGKLEFLIKTILKGILFDPAHKTQYVVYIITRW